MSTTIPTHDFSRLPAYAKRRFVPEGAALTQKECVVGLYERLAARPVGSEQDFEQWLLDRSELEAAIDQQGAQLYVRMTCQTDHDEFAGAYKAFISEVVPAIRPLEDRLNRLYMERREEYPQVVRKYGIYDRAVKTDVELFREANVPLATQVSLLSQEYQTITGGMTVDFQGEERTMPQMGQFLEDPDRGLREAAWRATAGRRQRDAGRMEEIFDEMCRLRNQIAANAGCRDFIEFQFRGYHRFDYTPEDCKKYHAAIEQSVVPLWRKILEHRRQQMGLERLRPWDTAVDPLGRPPLRPFTEVDDLVGKVQKILTAIAPEFGREFQAMVQDGLLDLASRKGKAPGGYQSTLAEARRPFIFMNAVGMEHDVRTLLHESGHALHALFCAGQPLHAYRHAPMEFCEVASMSMELLADEHIGVFYDEGDRQRSIRHHFEDVIHILVWVAIVDAFQHWIYEHPGHSVEERRDEWVRLQERFGEEAVDWDGLDEFRRILWHRQLHIFEVPFYYIEYGIAQLGALQVWLNARTNGEAAVAAYRRGLALGGSRPLPELFEAAGIKFDFSAGGMAPLVAAVAGELSL